MAEYLNEPKTVLVKMEGKDLFQAWEDWNAGGGRKGTHLRFGQYVMNKFLPTVTDPLVFYCEDAQKSYSLLWDRYCFHD